MNTFLHWRPPSLGTTLVSCTTPCIHFLKQHQSCRYDWPWTKGGSQHPLHRRAKNKNKKQTKKQNRNRQTFWQHSSTTCPFHYLFTAFWCNHIKRSLTLGDPFQTGDPCGTAKNAISFFLKKIFFPFFCFVKKMF